MSEGLPTRGHRLGAEEAGVGTARVIDPVGAGLHGTAAPAAVAAAAAAADTAAADTAAAAADAAEGFGRADPSRDPAGHAGPLLRVDAVSVQVGGVTALRDVTLAIDRGEFVALVGANGAGKTTLLRVLHGLAPHTGRRVVAQPAPVQAMVFQRPFMLHLSVIHNLRLALWLGRDGTGAAERARRAQAALERVGLADRRERPAHVLSGGEQQRLALARAWAVRPDILFLDEPTASLDPSAMREVEALLAGFAAEGMTIVMSTHNLGQAQRLARRVVHLEQGAVGADLPTAAFFGGAAGERVERFLRGELPWSPR